MIQYLIRLAKRFAVLLPGIVIAYFSVHDIFPYFDRRLPLSFAIFFTYLLGAYVLVPAVIRLWRIFRPARPPTAVLRHADGFCFRPVEQSTSSPPAGSFINSMETGRLVRGRSAPSAQCNPCSLSTVYGWHYSNAPVSTLYLFGRKQDIAFEIPIEGVAGGRHHVRFWATNVCR